MRSNKVYLALTSVFCKSTSLTDSEEEIEILKEGGRRHAFILSELAKMVAPGISTQELEDKAREMIKAGGDKAAFLNYTPRGAKRPYPAALNISINDEIVHQHPCDGSYSLCSLPGENGHHAFLHCTQCGKIEEVCDELLCKAEHAIAKKAHFQPRLLMIVNIIVCL
jgi:hypothetical protein